MSRGSIFNQRFIVSKKSESVSCPATLSVKFSDGFTCTFWKPCYAFLVIQCRDRAKSVFHLCEVSITQEDVRKASRQNRWTCHGLRINCESVEKIFNWGRELSDSWLNFFTLELGVLFLCCASIHKCGESGNHGFPCKGAGVTAKGGGCHASSWKRWTAVEPQTSDRAEWKPDPRFRIAEEIDKTLLTMSELPVIDIFFLLPACPPAVPDRQRSP